MKKIETKILKEHFVLKLRFKTFTHHKKFYKTCQFKDTLDYVDMLGQAFGRSPDSTQVPKEIIHVSSAEPLLH